MSTPAAQSRPVRIFCSYAHEDDQLRAELVNHLSPLRLEGRIDLWHDRRIDPGTEWGSAIDDNLESADLILLLLSSAFVSSAYCTGKEMRRALERGRSGQAQVVPIVLRPVDWQKLEIASFQALPTDGKPITKWDNQDEGLENVAVGIRTAVDRISGVRPPPAVGLPAPPPAQRRRWRLRRVLAGAAAVLVGATLLWCAALARQQVREGETWLNIRRPEEAEAAFARALRFNPLSSNARFGRDKAQIWSKQEQDVVSFERAAKSLYQSRPHDPHVNLWLGNIAYARQKTDDAIKYYQEACRLSSGLAEAWWALGVVYQEGGQDDQALAMYRKAVAISEETPRYGESLADLLAKRGDTETASQAYRTNAGNQYLLAKIELAKLLWAKGDLAAAKAEQEQAIGWLGQQSIAGSIENRGRWSFHAIHMNEEGEIDIGTSEIKICYARLELAVTLCLLQDLDAGPRASAAFRDCQSYGANLMDIVAADLQRLVAQTPARAAAIKSCHELLSARQ
jgi:tetratricopeptide (TPR) repeat protein